jgi:hypothetical protein
MARGSPALTLAEHDHNTTREASSPSSGRLARCARSARTSSAVWPSRASMATPASARVVAAAAQPEYCACPRIHSAPIPFTKMATGTSDEIAAGR